MACLLTMAGPIQAWKYRPWVQEYVDQQLWFMARHGSPTIGFHVRRGNPKHPENSRGNPWILQVVARDTFSATSHVVQRTED